MTDSRNNGSTDPLEAALSAAADSVLVELENERKRVEKLELELHDARERVKRGERVLYAARPELRPEKTDKPTKSNASVRKDGRYAIAETTIDEIESWIRSVVDEDETFSTSELEKLEGAPKSGATISVALRNLHERGVVTLDSLGGAQSSRKKNYRFTPLNP